jgi:hypothetical protein
MVTTVAAGAFRPPLRGADELKNPSDLSLFFVLPYIFSFCVERREPFLAVAGVLGP